MQISRLFEMLYILQDRGQVTAAELAKRLEVSVRTVYRDAQALAEAGVPVYAEPGRSGGLRVMPGYELSKSVLSEAERRQLLAALQAMEQVGAADSAVLRKLTAFLGGAAPDWVQIDFSDWSGQQDALFSSLKVAILVRRQVELDYCAESGEELSRRVCPMKLWFKGHTWYLRAWCTHKRAMRTFKLTRIRRARMLDDAFPPEAQDAPIAAYDAQSAPPMMCYTLRVDASMAYRVYDDFEPERIERLPDGDFIVRAAFPAGEWNYSLILGYGEHAQIVEPEWLRAEIADKLQKMLNRYET